MNVLIVYAHWLKIYLGVYTWLMNGADAIVFADDVGVRSWKLREKVCGGVTNLGVDIDAEANRNAPANEATRGQQGRVADANLGCAHR